MKEIKLNNGGSTMVDDDLFEALSKFNWRKDKLANHVCITTGPKNKRRTLRMHRLIMEAKDGEIVDHINGNTLDNRKENLRIANKSENGMNRKKQSNNTSGYKGVCKHSQTNKWVAQIIKGSYKWQCSKYSTAIEAAIAYDKKAIELHGEFANLNFPRENYE
jgi:hypothetical protein